MELNLLEKIFIGSYSIKIGKSYHSFNKLAPYMILSILLTGFTQSGLPTSNSILFHIGIVWVFINMFFFIYPLIFSSRCNPTNIIDIEKFITKINYGKKI